jgi:hypothetical protein
MIEIKKVSIELPQTEEMPSANGYEIPSVFDIPLPPDDDENENFMDEDIFNSPDPAERMS